jgi:hypothetical protein
LIDSWRNRVGVQVDVISRLKPGSSTWDFYDGADIKDGWLVFSGVQSLRFEPPGPVPNDLINDISVRPVVSDPTQPVSQFELSIGSVDHTGTSTEVLVRIEAVGVHLEDPLKPGDEITS